MAERRERNILLGDSSRQTPTKIHAETQTHSEYPGHRQKQITFWGWQMSHSPFLKSRRNRLTWVVRVTLPIMWLPDDQNDLHSKYGNHSRFLSHMARHGQTPWSASPCPCTRINQIPRTAEFPCINKQTIRDNTNYSGTTRGGRALCGADLIYIVPRVTLTICHHDSNGGTHC